VLLSVALTMSALGMACVSSQLGPNDKRNTDDYW
jgi:hypothetical protein